MSEKTLSDKLIVVAILLLVALAVWMVIREAQSASQAADLPAAFVYNIDKLRHIDPELINYHESQTLDVNLQELLGISVTTDAIYICGAGGVRIYSHQGDERGSWMHNTKVESIAALNKNTIFIATENYVSVCDAEGKVLHRWPAFASKGWIRSLEVTADYLFVALVGEGPRQRSGSVFVCQHDGTIVRQIANEKGEHSIIVPGPHIDIQWSESAQVLYVANPGRHRMQAYDIEGNFLQSWGKSGVALDAWSGCCNPTTFDLGADGSFITAEKGLARVKRMHRDGSVRDVVAAPKSFYKKVRLYDLEIFNERVFVLDNYKKQLRVFAENEDIEDEGTENTGENEEAK